jgi:RNA recognition motif-containing protein
MKLYVGNLSYDTDDRTLNELFAPYGQVTDTHVVMDRMTQRPRGFAFVTMSTEDAGRAAIKGLHGRSVEGRDLTVNEARPMEARSGGGGGGGNGSGGGFRSRRF